MKRRAFVGLLAGAVSSGTAPAMRSPWDRLRSRGFTYLAKRQSKDGGWRSEVYGAFKSGHGLTPLVANACWSRLEESQRALTVKWLLGQGSEGWSVFPVHNAGWLLSLVQMERRLESLRPLLVNQLRGLQFSAKRGWAEGSGPHGGWSYGGRAVEQEAGRELAAMEEPNLSATVLAVAGLRCGGVPGGDPVLVAAARFISSCQNFRGKDGGKFDDGGFFQMGHDVFRNKAGVAGRDAEGRKRLRSYYSATADGLRGLLMCGVPVTDPRVVAARNWMVKNPNLGDVPDLVFYAAFARAEAGKEWVRGHLKRVPPSRCFANSLRNERLILGSDWSRGGIPSNSLPGVFPDLNSLRQDQDGSYTNPAGEMRENDPLVATSLMMMAGGPWARGR